MGSRVDPSPRTARAQIRRSHLLLTYNLASSQTTTTLLDHPVVRRDVLGHRRRGMNVASVTVSLLAQLVPPGRVAAIPHPRAAALVAAARDLPDHQTTAGDRRYIITGPDGETQPVRLDQIPLPAGTPPSAVFEQHPPLKIPAAERRLRHPDESE